MPTLETELQAFDAALPELLMHHLDRFALFKGTELVGIFDSYEDAMRDGYTRFGLEPFFVGPVAPPRTVAMFARDRLPCPA
jgi:hypothetical protein